MSTSLVHLSLRVTLLAIKSEIGVCGLVDFVLQSVNMSLILTFTSPFIANIFAEYNQQDATFLNLFISVRRSS